MKYQLRLFVLLMSVSGSIYAMHKTRHYPSKKVAIVLLTLAILAQQQQVEAPPALIPSVCTVPDSIPSTLSYATHHALMQSMHEQHFLRGDSAMVAIGKIVALGVCASLFVSFCFPS